MKKINFMVSLGVNYANPNGDSLEENRPRTTWIDGSTYGEISDVCLKRKIRNILISWYASNPTEGMNIFVQSDDHNIDGHRTLKDRFDSFVKKEKIDVKKDKDKCVTNLMKEYYDVRAFGAVMAFADKLSIGIKGPITFMPTFSIEPVSVKEMQITKSVSSKPNEKNPENKSSDTMGMKYCVENGVYIVKGTINACLAEKTGFSEEDAKVFLNTLSKLFENDESSARPAGSMRVIQILWAQHNSKEGSCSSYNFFNAIKVNTDGTFDVIDKEIVKDVSINVTNGF